MHTDRSTVHAIIALSLWRFRNPPTTVGQKGQRSDLALFALKVKAIFPQPPACRGWWPVVALDLWRWVVRNQLAPGQQIVGTPPTATPLPPPNPHP